MLNALSDADQLACHEVTSTALRFSHFYRLDVIDDKTLIDYISKSKGLNIVDRIPVGAGKCMLKPGAGLPNDPLNSEFDWDDPGGTKAKFAKQNSIVDGKRTSVFFVEWADKSNRGNG